MVPFDGLFAQNYVLPLAVAAYDATTPPEGLAYAWPILADPDRSDAHFAQTARAANRRHRPIRTRRSFAAMVKQPVKPPKDLESARAERSRTASPIPDNLHFGWVCADIATASLIVAIRGTVYFEDWIDDFDFASVRYEAIAGAGTVHDGFQQVYYTVRQSILGSICEAMRECPGLGRMLIAGHSLGAALAGLGAPELLRAAASLKPAVYTFAEPRVGHRNYSHFFSAHVPVCYRIVNRWDIVPHLPPFVFGYNHEGEKLGIDSGFGWSVAKNHELATGYAPGLARWLREHPPSDGATLG